MPKPAERILRGNTGQCLDNGLLECLARASADSPQGSFQFGERLLDWREIRRIRWQEEELASSRFDRLLNARPSMSREIVQDHDLARAQAGSQDLLNIRFKGGLVGGAIQQHRFPHARKRQRSDQGQIGSIIARNLPNGALASWRIGVQRGHVGSRIGLIDDDQICRGQLLGLFTPGGAFRLVLLARS